MNREDFEAATISALVDQGVSTEAEFPMAVWFGFHRHVGSAMREGRDPCNAASAMVSEGLFGDTRGRS